MGTAESSQSSELGVIAGLANPSSFHQQSPNVARLIRGETSSKMEYEFPISDLPPGSSPYHHHHHSYGGGGGGSAGSNANHSISPNRPEQTYAHSPSALTSPSASGHLLGTPAPLARSKLRSSQASNLWLTLASCFGCRARHANDASTNSLRDKVHAIRIVRASNDLTPAVFDSHYNIITLEQLRECDNNGGGTIGSLPNDVPDSATSPNPTAGTSNQNGNGSAAASKAEHGFRMKKKKKKRSSAAASASKGTGSDDDDERS